MFGSPFNPLEFIFGLVALLLAIDIHEFSHAWMADRLGDPTPRMQGRLTLNPLAHLDPVGTILLVLIRFGWGKPVVFDPYNLKNPRRDGALISIAGPIANILLATACSLFLALLFFLHVPVLSSPALVLTLSIGTALLQELIVFNVILAVFNLVPIHPLDGFKIVEGILPEQAAVEWHELERYGFIFLLFLLFPVFGGQAPITRIIGPVIDVFLRLFLPNTPLL